MPSELLLLYFGLLQCLPHTVSVVPTSIVVESPASVTVSAVATTVGAAVPRSKNLQSRFIMPLGNIVV